MNPALTAALAAATLALFPASASAQSAAPGATPANPTPEYVCGLMTKAQVEKAIGRELFSDGDGMKLGNGALCDFDGGEAQVMLFMGPNGEANWEGMLEGFGHKDIKRTPVPGLGAPAYVIYPPAENEYQSEGAMVVVKTGENTLVISTSVNEGEPVEKALAPTLELVKIVLPKLK